MFHKTDYVKILQQANIPVLGDSGSVESGKHPSCCNITPAFWNGSAWVQVENTHLSVSRPTPLSKEVVDFLQANYLGNKSWCETFYPLLEYQAHLPWKDFSNSRPLADFDRVKKLAGSLRYKFGQRSCAIMHQETYQLMASNQNRMDLYGARKPAGVLHPMRIADVLDHHNLPMACVPGISTLCPGFRDPLVDTVLIIGISERGDYYTEHCPEWSRPGEYARCLPFLVVMRIG